jgi:hypothetical protein
VPRCVRFYKSTGAYRRKASPAASPRHSHLFPRVTSYLTALLCESPSSPVPSRLIHARPASARLAVSRSRASVITGTGSRRAKCHWPLRGIPRTCDPSFVRESSRRKRRKRIHEARLYKLAVSSFSSRTASSRGASSSYGILEKYFRGDGRISTRCVSKTDYSIDRRSIWVDRNVRT